MTVSFQILGNAALMEMPKVAFLSSRRVAPAAVMRMPMLTPGDFNAVNGRLRYLPESARTADRIEAELRKELSAKDSHAGRTMGF